MAVVGSATVVVRALATQFREDLKTQFDGAEKDADRAGGRAGGRFGGSFREALKDDTGAIDFSGLRRLAERAGGESGQGFLGNFGQRLRGLDDTVANSLRGVRDRFGAEGGTSGGSFMSNLSNRLRGMDQAFIGGLSRVRQRFGSEGDLSAKSFFSNLLRRATAGFSDFSQEAETAGGDVGRSFSAIKIDMPDVGSEFFTKLLAIIPLVGVLGGGIAALVGGLFALAGAAVYAAGSLAALATGVGALGLGLGTLFLAFSGVFKALGALNRQQATSAKNSLAAGRASQQQADQIRSAQQRVAEAEYALSQARKNAAEQSVQDAHSVADAEYSLQQAQQSAKDAQDALTQARKDARSTLIDLQLQLRGSVLSEEEAALRLQKAQQDYQATLNNPAASAMDREQARLNLEEAELAVDEAKKQNKDLQKQTEDANKKGVAGAANVVAAKKRVKDSNHSVQEAEYALAQARQHQADDAITEQHNVAKAVEEVANAQRALKEAYDKTSTAGTAGANAVAAAFKNMTPEAIKFTKFLFSLKPKFKELQTAAGSRLFGPLMDDIKLLVGQLFPVLKEAVKDTSAGMAQWFGAITNALVSSGFLRNFRRLADVLTETGHGRIVSDWTIMGRIIGNVLKALAGLALAAEPIFRRFLRFLDRVSTGWAEAFRDTKGVHSARSELEAMGGVAAKFGHTFGLLWGVLKNIFGGGGGLNAGVGILNDINNTLQDLFDKTKKGGSDLKPIQDFFKNIREPLSSVMHFLGALGKEFLKLGENGTLTRIFDEITAAMPQIEHAIETFTNKVAPAAIHAIAQLIDLFDRLTNTPAFNVFVGIMKVLITLVSDFVKVLTIGPIGKFTGAILGLAAAYVVLRKALKVTGLKALGQSIQVGRAPIGTERAKAATGLGAIIQGGRGQPVIDKATGQESRASKLGRFALGQRIPTRDLREESSLASVERAGGAGRRGLSRASKLGLAAGGAVLAAGLAEGIIHSHSIGEAAKNVGHEFVNNLDTILLLAGPSIVGGLSKGIKKAAPFLKDAATSLGGGLKNAIKDRIAKGGEGGEGGFLNVMGFLKKGKSAEGAAGAAKDAEGAAGKFGKLGSVFSKVSGVGSKVSGVIGKLGPALGLLADPITLVVLGIAALAIGAVILYKKWKPFRDIVNQVGHGLKIAGEFIKNVAVKAFDILKKHMELLLIFLGPFGIAILGIIELFKHVTIIEKIVKDMFGIVVSLFKLALTPLRVAVTVIMDVLIGIWNALKDTVIAVVKLLWDTVKNNFETAKNVLLGIFQLFKDLFTGKWGKLKDDVLNIIKALWDGVRTQFNTAVNFLKTIGTTIYNAVVGTFKNIKSDITGIMTDVFNIVKGLPGKIIGLAGDFLKAGANIGRALIRGIWNLIKGGVAFVDHIAHAIANAIIEFVKEKLPFHGFGFGKNTQRNSAPGVPVVPGLGGDPSTGAGSAAYGATILPRPGGTFMRLAEAGQPESVVDTGLINARLRDDAGRENATVAELRMLRAVLERVERLGGINIENINATAAPHEQAAVSVPRALRSLAFELGA